MMSTPHPYPSVANGGPIPDDAQIERSQPSVCVDYLSHNWTDEDVWSSWKAMTKKKYEIANGVRLENASWRTWAKQRGKLRTVSPETLNWLKDSDVTWLYGPLHESASPVPPPKIASVSERFGLDLGQGHQSSLAANGTPDFGSFHSQHQNGQTDGAAPEAYPPAKRPVDEMGNLLPPSGKALFSHAGFGGYVNKSGKKSILKHRTIGDILTHPGQLAGQSTDPAASSSVRTLDETDTDGSTASGNLPASKSLPGGSDTSVEPPRRHITFNSRVEQCIALDPKETDEYNEHLRSARFASSSSSDEEEEEEEEEEDEDGQDDDIHDDDDDYDYDEQEDEVAGESAFLNVASDKDDGRRSDSLSLNGQEVEDRKNRAGRDFPATTNQRPSRSSSSTRRSTSTCPDDSPSRSPKPYPTIALLAPAKLKAFGPAAKGAPQVVDPTGFTMEEEEQAYYDYDIGLPNSQRTSWQLVDDEDEEEEEDDREVGEEAEEEVDDEVDDDEDEGEEGEDEGEVVDGAGYAYLRTNSGSSFDSSAGGAGSRLGPSAGSGVRANISYREGNEEHFSATATDNANVNGKSVNASPPSSASADYATDHLARASTYAHALPHAQEDEPDIDMLSPAPAFLEQRGRPSQRARASAADERRQEAARRPGRARVYGPPGSYAAAAAAGACAAPSTTPSPVTAEAVTTGPLVGGGGTSPDYHWTPSPHDERSVDDVLARLARQKYARATKGALPPAPASDLSVHSDWKDFPPRPTLRTTVDPGPTPGNTPILPRKTRARSGAGSGSGSGSGSGRRPRRRASVDDDEADGGSPIIPRRPNATGAVVAPRGAGRGWSGAGTAVAAGAPAADGSGGGGGGSGGTKERQETVNVPLAADYVSEEEGGLIARAAEIVNTARDLLGTLWGAREASAWRE